jgi:hypothetical protein
VSGCRWGPSCARRCHPPPRVGVRVRGLVPGVRSLRRPGRRVLRRCRFQDCGSRGFGGCAGGLPCWGRRRRRGSPSRRSAVRTDPPPPPQPPRRAAVVAAAVEVAKASVAVEVTAVAAGSLWQPYTAAEQVRPPGPPSPSLPPPPRPPPPRSPSSPPYHPIGWLPCCRGDPPPPTASSPLSLQPPFRPPRPPYTATPLCQLTAGQGTPARWRRRTEAAPPPSGPVPRAPWVPSSQGPQPMVSRTAAAAESRRLLRPSPTAQQELRL